MICYPSDTTQMLMHLLGPRGSQDSVCSPVTSPSIRSSSLCAGGQAWWNSLKTSGLTLLSFCRWGNQMQWTQRTVFGLRLYSCLKPGLFPPQCLPELHIVGAWMQRPMWHVGIISKCILYLPFKYMHSRVVPCETLIPKNGRHSHWAWS